MITSVGSGSNLKPASSLSSGKISATLSPNSLKEVALFVGTGVVHGSSHGLS